MNTTNLSQPKPEGLFATSPTRDEAIDALDQIDQAEDVIAVCTEAVASLDDDGRMETVIAVLIRAHENIGRARATLADAVMRDAVLAAIDECHAKAVAS